MGVQVDEAGCDDQASRVDLLGARPEIRPDRDDAFAVDGDIGRKRVAAETIDNRPAADHQVMHVTLLGKEMHSDASICAKPLSRSTGNLYRGLREQGGQR
jgi:hypothetical protein